MNAPGCAVAANRASILFKIERILSCPKIYGMVVVPASDCCAASIAAQCGFKDYIESKGNWEDMVLLAKRSLYGIKGKLSVVRRVYDPTGPLFESGWNG